MKIYKIHLIILLSVIFSFNAFTQKNTVTFCDFGDSSESIISPAIGDLCTGIPTSNSYSVRIYIHIIRQSNQTGGQSIAAINDAMSILNSDFSPHGISFLIIGTYDYIDSDSYYNNPNIGVFGTNPHDDGIDIYFFDDISTLNNGQTSSSISTSFLVSGTIASQSLTRSRVVSHEMGHIFRLLHTYTRNCSNDGYELTNGTDCSTRGDRVCDTPADPYNSGHPNSYPNPYPNVDENCNWTGVTTDNNCPPHEAISSYNPDITNIMAYAPVNCMDHFTSGQGLRMREYLECISILRSTWISNFVCPEDVIVDNRVFPYEFNSVISSNTITSSSIIYSNAAVEYNAGYDVILIPGFNAKSGSNFIAYISGCMNTNPWLPKSKNTLKNNVNSKFIEIYPNPTKSKITIQTEKGVVSWVITNPFGKTHFFSNETKTINISNLPNGIYFLKALLIDGNVIVKKIIKN